MNKPVTDAERLLAEPSRQSPLAVIFLAWRLVRQISLVNLVVVFAVITSGRLPISGAALAGAVVVILGVSGGLSWWRFVFVVTDGELRVTKGVLSEEKLAIPLSRVQTVSLEQGLLHQILNLTRVAVDTAGSSETEFKFDALERRRAEALREVVGEHRAAVAGVTQPAVDGFGVGGPAAGGSVLGDAAAAPPTGPRSEAPPPPGVETALPTEVIARRSVADLVKIGVGSWPWAGLVFLVPLLAALDELREVAGLDVLDDLSGRLEEVGQSGGPDVPIPVLVAAAVATVIVVTIAGWLLQIVRSVITNWEFTLTRMISPAGESLRRDAGLFNRTSLAANLARVQGVRSSQTLMQRWLGIRRLVLSITGEADLAIPGTTDDEFDRIERLVLVGQRPSVDRIVSKAWVFLEVRNRVLSLIIPAVVVAVVFRWWALGLLVFVASGVVGAYWAWRCYRWGFTDERLAVNSGLLIRRTHDVEFVKAQSVDVEQSFFQRRRGLATFRLRTAEKHVDVHMITVAEAEALRDVVLFHVESSSRSWM